MGDSLGTTEAAEASTERRAMQPPDDWAQRRRFLEAHVAASFTLGNTVTPLHNGDHFFPPMLRAIRQARHSVNLLTYIFRKGSIAESFCESLCQKAVEGVTVRLLLDGIGSAEIEKAQLQRMRDAGVEARWFRKPHLYPTKADNRSHRKILVCDGRIGFTGGMGIGMHWEGDAENPDRWRESQFQFEGPSVHGLNASFWENWIEANPGAVPERMDFPSPKVDGKAAVQVISLNSGRSDQTAKMLLLTLFQLARWRIDIVTAYFAPDRHCLQLLKDRAREGVRVRLLIPGQHTDVRMANWEAERYFSELLEAGVRVYRYQPTMLHVKSFLIDDDLALVGSLNLDKRAFRKDEEIAAVVQDADFVEQMDASLEEDLASSEEVRREEWRGRSIGSRLLGLLTLPFRGQL